MHGCPGNQCYKNTFKLIHNVLSNRSPGTSTEVSLKTLASTGRKRDNFKTTGVHKNPRQQVRAPPCHTCPCIPYLLNACRHLQVSAQHSPLPLRVSSWNLRWVLTQSCMLSRQAWAKAESPMNVSLIALSATSSPELLLDC